MEPRWSSMGLAASIASSAARSIASGVTAWPSSDRSAAVARTGVGATDGERDARLGATPSAMRELRGDADHGDVELASRRVAQVLAAAAGARRGHDELDQQLVGRQHRLAHAR